MVRFPKGTVAEPIEAVGTDGDVDVLHECEGDPDLLIVSVGAMAPLALQVADKLTAEGRRVRVLDPRWVLPVSDALVQAARRAGAVAVIEDNIVDGGIGSALSHAVTEAGGPLRPLWCYGIPRQFLDHASRSQILEQVGLTPDQVATSLTDRLRGQ